MDRITAPVLSAFDPGSQRMGFCVGSGSTLPTAGAWRFPQTGENLGAMLCWLDDALRQHFDTYAPAFVVYEAPLLLRHDTLGRLRKTLNLGGHIEFVCERRGIPCSEVSHGEGKAFLAGSKQAEKSDMVAAAERLGVALPKTKAEGREDAADSVGLWLAFLAKHSRALLSRFDRALYGGRANALI